MKLSLNSQIFLGVALGLGFGLFLLFGIGTEAALGSSLLFIANLVGKLFIASLKMILIPLVFVSICVGIANLKAHAQMNLVWTRALGYFFTTTGLAVLLGLISVNIFQPGKGLDTTLFQDAMQSSSVQELTLIEFIQNFLLQLFKNPVTAMANGDVLATVIFAILVGIALVVTGQKTEQIHTFLEQSFEITMLIVDWIMRFAPFGIAGLITKLVATQDLDLLNKLLYFILIVIGTFLVHGLIVLPALLKIMTGRSPIEFFQGIKKALITAFSTSSSSATLPITMDCVEENLKVDKNIAGFVLPLGATINMDGTALYEAVAAIFVANLVGIDLNLAQQVTVFFMSMIAAIGAPGIPSAGMVTMAMVLQSVGLPVEAIAILLPIDRLLDAVRTTINVEGDAIGSCVVEALIREET